ncbi:hypothetical protein L596_017944 [Steinernema carpocapsae]|uniref:G-protein coupled receptors family 1 profile domain-containing protein n=1 Tax=Steinernema carpocapsae TaxID=34508 RepID=A0A4U5N363_STECR|nr:hypothetical protein L596_017944 [Steinernema carpocapsae]
MTGANVVSIFGFHSLLIFYFISLQFGLKLPFAICSFLRSFKQMIVSPAFYSCLLVAVERYVLIFYGYNMSPYHVLGSYVLLGLPHIVMFISQQIYYTISMQDICGYTKMSKIAQLENLINALNIIYPFLAVLLNLRMLHFVLRFKTTPNHPFSVRNLPREKVVLIGLLIQAILPLVTTTPETTMYFLYVNAHFCEERSVRILRRALKSPTAPGSDTSSNDSQTRTDLHRQTKRCFKKGPIEALLSGWQAASRSCLVGSFF